MIDTDRIKRTYKKDNGPTEELIHALCAEVERLQGDLARAIASPQPEIDRMSELLNKTLAENDRLRAKPETCTWSLEEPDYGGWKAECCAGTDKLFCLTEGGPIKNEFKFCPYCGNKLIEAADALKDDNA